jgi:hypothetical protein
MKNKDLVILVTGLPPIDAASIKLKMEQRDEQIRNKKLFTAGTNLRGRWLYGNYGHQRRASDKG